jgi:uncharacterized membrane protein
MFDRAELKEMAKSQLNGKWGSGVLVTFVFGLVYFGVNIASIIPFFGSVGALLVECVLEVGFVIVFLNFIKRGDHLEVGDIFKGFDNFGKSLGIVLWTALWTFLWTLVFIIPGIIKNYAYSQSIYIIADNPKVNVLKSMKISMKMTQGYKWQIFVMDLSFIGWGLLCILTLGIGFLWLVPYRNTAWANMYYKLKRLSIENSVCTEADYMGDQTVPPITTMDSASPVDPNLSADFIAQADPNFPVDPNASAGSNSPEDTDPPADPTPSI